MQSDGNRIDPAKLKRKRIGVLMGGLSFEREVSLNSGRAILDALVSLGYDAVAVDVGRDVADRLREQRIEVAFIGLHGRFGEDGVIQGLLELLHIPYTGSGVLASALGMNKIYSKRIFAQAGLPLLPYKILTRRDAAGISSSSFEFGLPLVVKPSCEGSSIGVSIVKEEAQLLPALEKAWKYDDEAIVEEYIVSREIQIGVLDDESLGTLEVVPNREFYDYEAKYTDGGAKHLVPAPISERQTAAAIDLALAAHKSLGCEGATRVDLLLHESRGFFLLEVNTLPGMTNLSLLPEIAAHKGISFPQLVQRILQGARLRVE